MCVCVCIYVCICMYLCLYHICALCICFAKKEIRLIIFKKESIIMNTLTLIEATYIKEYLPGVMMSNGSCFSFYVNNGLK